MPVPLAERIRPHDLDEVVGQSHLLGKDKPLRRIIESGKIPNMIFYGSSGIGKNYRCENNCRKRSYDDA